MNSLKITCGRYRGRRLKMPPGRDIRPTLTRCKKSLFDIIASLIPPHKRFTMQFADIFAGCGAIGLEAMSLGFGEALLLENNPTILPYLQDNIDTLNYAAAQYSDKQKAILIKSDALTPPPRKDPVDVIFFDPPYDSLPRNLLTLYEANRWIAQKTLIIIQHDSKISIAENINNEGYHISDSRHYGAGGFTFMHKDS